MFTGIIQAIGIVKNIENQDSNLVLTIDSLLSSTLKIDQSVAHNGICLTVTECGIDGHKVTAVAETISKTNIGTWQIGMSVNLELAMVLGSRLDGHLVQGHVDTAGKIIEIENQIGSWIYTIQYPPHFAHLVIEKGSVCLNGISLTCFQLRDDTFQVAIIPYTFEHTNIQFWKVGENLNIEFDIIGKYLERKLLIDRK